MNEEPLPVVYPHCDCFLKVSLARMKRGEPDVVYTGRVHFVLAKRVHLHIDVDEFDGAFSYTFLGRPQKVEVSKWTRFLANGLWTREKVDGSLR